MTKQLGIKPKFREQDDRPEPTQSLQAREALDLNKNVGKTQIVQSGTSGKGPKGPGFYVSHCPFPLMVHN
jgi:U4/U6.U5 tri-snRNP component SNU23